MTQTPALPLIPYTGEWRWRIGPSPHDELRRVELQEFVSVAYGLRKRKRRFEWVTRQLGVVDAFDDERKIYRVCQLLMDRQESQPLPSGIYTRNGHYAG